MTQLQAPTMLVGRILLALIFVVAGYGKIGGYAGTQQYMESSGLPGILLPLVILLELGGGLAIIVGFMTRWMSLALAGLTLLSAIIFHNEFGDQTQSVMFLKNLAITGGFLLLAVHGPGAWSLDARRGGNAVLA